MNSISKRIQTALTTRLGRRQAGVTLGETLIVLVIGGALLGLAFVGLRTANSNLQSDDLGRGAVTLAGEIKRVNQTGGYASVSADTVKGIVPGNWKYDGTDVLDSAGNAVGLSGAVASFAMIFNNLSEENCRKVIPSLAGMAYKVNVGAVTGAAGVISGGSTYKAANGTVDGAAAATGCAVANAKIGIEVR